MINGKKIALTLSGGGSKGFAHVGVLKVLEKNGIVPDIITGTSMGSIVGGLYACGISPKVLEEKILKLKVLDFFDLNAFNIIKEGASTGKKMVRFLQRIGANVNIEDLKIKFACVACDLKTGTPYIFDKGNLAVAMRCSSSVPGLFAPYKLDDKLLVDGGVVNNNPFNVARDMGADFVIAVDCIGKACIVPNMKTVADVLMSTFSITQCKHESLRKNNSDIKLVIENEQYGYAERTKEGIKNLIHSGEIVAEKNIGRIKAKLKKF